MKLSTLLGAGLLAATVAVAAPADAQFRGGYRHGYHGGAYRYGVNYRHGLRRRGWRSHSGYAHRHRYYRRWGGYGRHRYFYR